jgi:hypothetical protein
MVHLGSIAGVGAMCGCGSRSCDGEGTDHIHGYDVSNGVRGKRNTADVVEEAGPISCSGTTCASVYTSGTVQVSM